MNIIEAVKSGKKFRRPGLPFKEYKNFAREDILADDWEIEEKKVEVTRSDFTKAWTDAEILPGALPQMHRVLEKLGL